MVRKTRFCELILTSQLCALLCCKNLFIILQFIWHCCCCCSPQSQTSRYRSDYCHLIRIVYCSAYRFKTPSAVCKNNKYGRVLSISMTTYHYFKLMSAIFVQVYLTCRCRLVIQHFFLTYSLLFAGDLSYSVLQLQHRYGEFVQFISLRRGKLLCFHF